MELSTAIAFGIIKAIFLILAGIAALALLVYLIRGILELPRLALEELNLFIEIFWGKIKTYPKLSIFFIIIFIILPVVSSLVTYISDADENTNPKQMQYGITVEDSAINKILAQSKLINEDCDVQELTDKQLGMEFAEGDNKYILVPSTCTNVGGNQNFNYVNLIELTKVGKLIIRDSVKIIGDLQSISVKNGLIAVKYLGFGKGDANCCPSNNVQDSYRIQAGKLVKK